MSVSGLQIVGRVLVTSCLDKLIRCYDVAVRNSSSIDQHLILKTNIKGKIRQSLRRINVLR